MPTDADIITEVICGNSEAYGLLVQKYQGAVYGLCYHSTGNFADAQDLAQEAFIQAYLSLEQLRNPSSFAGWLRQIAANLCKRWHQKQRNDVISIDEVDRGNLIAQRPILRPDEEVEKKELHEAIMKAVESLPEHYRLAVTLFYMDGLDYAEIADFLGVPSSTVRGRLYKARQLLKGEMIKMVSETFDANKPEKKEFTEKVLEQILKSVESDGSLGRHGIEIQVPASNGGTTENLVHQACQSLDDSGFEISKQCGLHVHIEYPSQWKTIKNLLLMIYACEPVFYAINPQSRQNNNFCQPLYKSFSVHEIVKAKAMEIDKLFYSKKHPDLTKRKIADFKKSKWNDCRYFGFNLHSLFYQKTVEFRYHSGTMEENKILRWIKLLKSILLYVRFNYDQQKVLRLTEQPSVLGKIKYLKTMLKLDELLSSCLVSRYIKFQK